MRALLIILSHEVVHEERLAAARRTQHELVAVRGDAPLHGQVADVEVQRFPCEPVDVYKRQAQPIRNGHAHVRGNKRASTKTKVK